jgi:hypothetical protein
MGARKVSVLNSYLCPTSTSAWHFGNFLSERCISYPNEKTLGGLLAGLGIGASCQGKQPCDYKVETITPHPQPQVGERGWKLLINVQWFDQSCLHTKASIKTQKDQVWTDAWLLNICRFLEVMAPRKAMEVPPPSHIFCGMLVFHLHPL